MILETSVPTKFPYKQGYDFYSRYLLPLLGRFCARDQQAYSYLSKSAKHFPNGQDFTTILKKIGFQKVQYKPLTFGVASIYTASKNAPL